MMLASLWEVDLQPINYYFFSTNCSYVLLSLLKVGRPDLPLTDPFPIYAIPVDTVRSVIDNTGLLRGATFRPSQRTQIGERWRLLDDHARSIALGLADGDIEADDSAVRALSPPKRAAALELAQAYLQYRLDTANIERDEMAPRSLALLRARSRIADASRRRRRRPGGSAGPGPPLGAARRGCRHDRRSAVRRAGAAACLSRSARSGRRLRARGCDRLPRGARALVRQRRAQPGNRHVDRYRVAYTAQ